MFYLFPFALSYLVSFAEDVPSFAIRHFVADKIKVWVVEHVKTRVVFVQELSQFLIVLVDLESYDEVQTAVEIAKSQVQARSVIIRDDEFIV